MATPAIETLDLTRDYGKIRAVDHINFVVHPGEVFGFLGPNGAGKTTAVRMLTTLLLPTSGKALLNGFDVVRQGYDARRQFGVVPEESNVYRELTARANLEFSARLYRVPKAEAVPRIAELLRRFDLAERANTTVDTFSRGMRRKLTIAMALVHRPSILFLDEPTAGLDVHGQHSIRQYIRQLSAEGITIFLTTHQLEEASELCNRVAIIDRGKIVALGTPERLSQAFRRLHSLEVAFEPMPDGLQAELQQLPGVDNAIKLGSRYRLYVPEPAELLPAVMRFAQERSLRVTALNTLSPSLEDVFLLITGKRRTGDDEEHGEGRYCRRGGHGDGRCRGDGNGSCRMRRGQ